MTSCLKTCVKICVKPCESFVNFVSGKYKMIKIYTNLMSFPSGFPEVFPRVLHIVNMVFLPVKCGFSIIST